MRRIFQTVLALIFAVGLTHSACAEASVATPSWNGFYIGGHIGGAWADSPYSFADPSNIAFAQCGACWSSTGFGPNALKSNGSGAAGGVHAGYGLMLTPAWLVGIEADITWTGLSSGVASPLTNLTINGAPFAVPGSNLSLNTDINWLASVRGRLGYATGDWLWYATGGVAWLDYDFTGNARCPTCSTGIGIVSATAFSHTRVGLALGGGLEWQAPASPWRLRAEYIYYAFNGTESGTALWTNTAGVAGRLCATGFCSAAYAVSDINIHTVRFGLSYAFH